jgi:DNA-directed RNA polymerase subunit RPC12/RpoP
VSLPQTATERQQLRLTEAAAAGAENTVSTACPECGTRFAMLARFNASGWHLRCTLCGCRRTGELKEGT